MPDNVGENKPTVSNLFPKSSRVLLTGSGKQFIERIGIDAAKRAVLSVMVGENLRTQTEPLTRQRVAQISGALITLFVRGALAVEDFTDQLSSLAIEQIEVSKKSDTAAIWPAQWLIGLTGKSVQNVLRSDPEKIKEYVKDFEAAIELASEKCRADMGDLTMTLGFAEDEEGRRVQLDWKDIMRLTTAIGSQTLTIRGSDKSLYGKLFERLILGSVLTILGFRRVNPNAPSREPGDFWLSDSSDVRESDATLLFKMGRLARFDIGFIGPGNSEISKDKLSRYAQEVKREGDKYSSTTFVIVDRLPGTGKTRQAAEQIGAEIIQMSMRCWPQDLARGLERRFGFSHELVDMPGEEIKGYLAREIEEIPIQDFLIGVSTEDVEAASQLQNVEEELEWVED